MLSYSQKCCEVPILDVSCMLCFLVAAFLFVIFILGLSFVDEYLQQISLILEIYQQQYQCGLNVHFTCQKWDSAEDEFVLSQISKRMLWRRTWPTICLQFSLEFFAFLAQSEVLKPCAAFSQLTVSVNFSIIYANAFARVSVVCYEIKHHYISNKTKQRFVWKPRFKRQLVCRFGSAEIFCYFVFVTTYVFTFVSLTYLDR